VDEVKTRAATPADAPLLWQMLTFAASMEGTAEDVAHVKHDPHLAEYVKGFGRAGDLGVVAYAGEETLGAAWLRLLHGEPNPMMVWTHDVPELAIALTPAARGRGVGTTLLRALIEAAADRYPAVLLSVREGNPAVHLYERFGFVRESELANRVGGQSIVMRRAASAQAALSSELRISV
jgi:ribosomal protein S18 acetylase RimI-like enzyme